VFEASRRDAQLALSNQEEGVLVLQGGGALGAYQAGVFEALHDAEIRPEWMAGISIGAINSALIAGNPPERRVSRLKEFWHLVSSAWPALRWFDDGPVPRSWLNEAGAALVLLFGVPGFFTPRVPLAPFHAAGTPGATSTDLMSVSGPERPGKGRKARALPWTRQGQQPLEPVCRCLQHPSPGLCGRPEG
jgi:predicted acylesterase/phospholipase RssA